MRSSMEGKCKSESTESGRRDPQINEAFDLELHLVLHIGLHPGIRVSGLRI